MKKKLLLLFAAIMTVSMAGCVEMESVAEDVTTDRLEISSEPGIEGGVVPMNLSQTLPVPGEEFSLVCTYDTLDYSFDKWRITDNKAISMTVRTEGLPEGYKVAVEHMHADISLKATTAQVDGITQDSMDDYSHVSPNEGFVIDNKTSYHNIFAIEGYTETFYQMWGYVCGSYGNVSSDYQRLTEGNLLDLGTYAEKMQVVYDLLIWEPGSENPHVVSVLSEFLIPVQTESK